MGIFKKIAPFLSMGLDLAGPYGTMAKAVLAPILKLKPDARPDEFSAALAGATPEQIEAIKAGEQQFQLQMKQLDINSAEEMQRMANEDVANARSREVELAKVNARDRMPMILGLAAVVSLLAGFLLLAFHQPPAGMKEVVILLIGAFGRDASAVYDYYFGSSKGSDDKTKVIADIAKS